MSHVHNDDENFNFNLDSKIKVENDFEQKIELEIVKVTRIKSFKDD